MRVVRYYTKLVSKPVKEQAVGWAFALLCKSFGLVREGYTPPVLSAYNTSIFEVKSQGENGGKIHVKIALEIRLEY
jgi:hypothetical protein